MITARLIMPTNNSHRIRPACQVTKNLKISEINQDDGGSCREKAVKRKGQGRLPARKRLISNKRIRVRFPIRRHQIKNPRIWIRRKTKNIFHGKCI
jgi:hypothetical protein